MTPPWAHAYAGRRVLLTGHTGFKGGWLAVWLQALGAEVTGYSLPAVEGHTLFEAARVAEGLRHVEGDIRDLESLRRTWDAARPEVVFHLAAQAIVRESYRDPLTTVTTNTLGTTHVLELARRSPAPVVLVLVTSDKCYENQEWERGYTEDDQLGGRDVYSGSKAAAEVIISSYRRSFFDGRVRASSARAGNVIGGGDWAVDRIVPDAITALMAGRPVTVRHPRAVRPWQHVLEPLSGYLLLGAQLLDPAPAVHAAAADAWNFGPAVENTRTVGELVEALITRWGAGAMIDGAVHGAPHEAGLLRLDIAKAAAGLGWRPRWAFDEAVSRTVEWYRAWAAGEEMRAMCLAQIHDYESAG
ncbi:MAG: CDP-glucose 4,6-dehydratase [Vicinamibacterales bacterium]|nr:CDP-glucose 4,6-dehydratase [Vicinamibacterales bacterium]